MKSPLALVFCLMLLFIPQLAAANENVVNEIVVPKLRCQTELTLSVIYEPTTKPDRRFDIISKPLFEWATFGVIIGERARMESEPGTTPVTRATTITTKGDINLQLTVFFLENTLFYSVKDPSGAILILWESGMDTPLRRIRQPRCK